MAETGAIAALWGAMYTVYRNYEVWQLLQSDTVILNQDISVAAFVRLKLYIILDDQKKSWDHDSIKLKVGSILRGRQVDIAKLSDSSSSSSINSLFLSMQKSSQSVAGQ